MTGAGGLFVPVAGLFPVLGPALAELTESAQIALGVTVAGMSGALIPMAGPGQIHRPAPAVLIEHRDS